MVQLDFNDIRLRLKKQDGRTFVFDAVRKKWLVLTPEEHVRQYLIQYLISRVEYPISLIAIEKKIEVGGMSKRFDIVVYNRQHEPWMLIECKEPQTLLNEKTLFQLLNYQRTTQCRYWVLTNGHQTYCADAGDICHVKWLDALPPYEL